MAATNSPGCRDIFSKSFKITPFRVISTTLNEIPKTGSQWREVVEKALKKKNDNGDEGTEELEINQVELEQDLAKMVSQHWTSKNPVHCEVRLLTHIYKEEIEAQPPVPRAYIYIGISKLSCRGCQVLIRAFNKVHHTKFS